MAGRPVANSLAITGCGCTLTVDGQQRHIELRATVIEQQARAVAGPSRGSGRSQAGRQPLNLARAVGGSPREIRSRGEHHPSAVRRPDRIAVRLLGEGQARGAVPREIVDQDVRIRRFLHFHGEPRPVRRDPHPRIRPRRRRHWALAAPPIDPDERSHAELRAALWHVHQRVAAVAEMGSACRSSRARHTLHKGHRGARHRERPNIERDSEQRAPHGRTPDGQSRHSERPARPRPAPAASRWPATARRSAPPPRRCRSPA